jgi:serine/threonine protein kinase
VYKAKWLSKNRQVACKVINVPPGTEHLEKSFRKELAAYAELSGPNILKTYGYNVQELSKGIRKCTLVMEFMHRGSLSDVLKQAEKISLRRKVEMACQIASGMRKLHAHRMIHRDIRPDNILVTHDYTAKIGDMGLARVLLPDDQLTLVGCVAYMPFDFYTGKYDQSLDVYTFGLTINELFTEAKHHYNILTRRIKLTNVSPVFADLITRCIHIEPSKRPSAIEIETTLWMCKQAFEKYIVEQHIEYGNMPTEDKNLSFITTYNALYPEISQIIKLKFPPLTRPLGEAVGGLNNDAIEMLRLLELLEPLGGR